jgi:hypothetical protein
MLTECYLGDEIKESETGGKCACMGWRRNVYKALVWKPEGDIQL